MLGHHRLASETPFKWCFAGEPLMADDGPLLVLFGSSFPFKFYFLKDVGPPLAKLSGSVHENVVWILKLKAYLSFYKSIFVIRKDSCQPALGQFVG